MPQKSLGFVFDIDTPSDAKIVPEQKNIVNNFDHIGDFLSLTRNKEETNADYKLRIWDVNVHPKSATLTGSINGLSRELGILREPAVVISLEVDGLGDWLAASPRIDILANKIILYNDWRPDGTEIIDKEISIYQPGSTGYYIEDLIAEINTSSYFSAVIDPDVRPNTPTTNLIRGNSDFAIYIDAIEGHNFTDLAVGNIVKDSLVFSEPDVFETEVFSDPAADGEYLVDYKEGTVWAYTLPSGEGSVSYRTAIFPFSIDYSPIEIYNLYDEDFESELFNKKTIDSGEEINTLPNTEGAEVFHAIFKESKTFWGE